MSIFHELFALAHVTHPNVVEFKGLVVAFPPENAQSAPVELGFVFEYCELGSLYVNMFEKHSLSNWRDRLSITAQVALGMASIHEQSFLHRWGDGHLSSLVLASGLH